MELQGLEDRLCSEQTWLMGMQRKMIEKGVPGAESVNLYRQLHLFVVKLRQSGIRQMSMYELKTYFAANVCRI